jgi:hypothetical protein
MEKYHHQYSAPPSPCSGGTVAAADNRNSNNNDAAGRGQQLRKGRSQKNEAEGCKEAERSAAICRPGCASGRMVCTVDKRAVPLPPADPQATDDAAKEGEEGCGDQEGLVLGEPPENVLWTEEEVRRLREVYSRLDPRSRNLWTSVSLHVRTKTSFECRAKVQLNSQSAAGAPASAAVMAGGVAAAAAAVGAVGSERLTIPVWMQHQALKAGALVGRSSGRGGFSAEVACR